MLIQQKLHISSGRQSVREDMQKARIVKAKMKQRTTIV